MTSRRTCLTCASSCHSRGFPSSIGRYIYTCPLIYPSLLSPLTLPLTSKPATPPPGPHHHPAPLTPKTTSLYTPSLLPPHNHTPSHSQELAKIAKGYKRGRDGLLRGSFITLPEIISFTGAILLCVAIVQTPYGRDTHAVIWDGWRLVLFIGPGKFDDRNLDGAILLSKEDVADAAHRDELTGKTATEAVCQKFGIASFISAHALMVNKRKAGLTPHL